MHCVTNDDPYRLAELGSMFFSVKKAIGGSMKLKSQIEKEEHEKMMAEINTFDEENQNGGSKIETIEALTKKIDRPKSEIVYMGGRSSTPGPGGRNTPGPAKFKTPKFF